MVRGKFRFTPYCYVMMKMWAEFNCGISKIHRIIFFVVLFIINASCLVYAEEDNNTIYYFYENFCDSCHPDKDFEKEFERITGESITGYIYKPYNVYKDKNVFNDIMDRMDVSEQDRKRLPIAVIKGELYLGDAEIQNKIPQDFIEKHGSPSDSVIYYLYLPSCGDCNEVRQVLDSLGEAIKVTRGGYTFTSKIIVNEIDISANAEIMDELFERYDVPLDQRIVPIVFTKDRFFSGKDAVESGLRTEIQKGRAIGTPSIKQSERLSSVTLFGAFMAGIVAGVNPCSLSMLLFFASLILLKKRRIWSLGLLFIAGKLLAYLLMGTLLIDILRRWNPVWLPLVSKVLLVGIGSALAFFNILDYIAVKSENYGKVRLQLPVQFRKFNHNAITHAVNNSKTALPLSVFIIGMVIASGEFLCTGQVFLATILTAMQNNLNSGMYYIFGVYCVAFILPPLALIILIDKGREVFDITEYVRKNMPVIKLATALLLVVLVIYSLFIN